MPLLRLVRGLRLVARGVVIVLVTAALWLFLLAGLLLLLPFERQRAALVRFVLRAWGRSMLSCSGGTLRVLGEAPRTAGILVTNHLSYADVLLLAATVPGRFVAKAEIRSWPFIGWISRTAGVLFIDRASRRDTARVAKAMEDAIAAGDMVILFPEGTSSCGHDVLPFRPPLLAPAAAGGLPVHYASVRYETEPPDAPAFLSVAWWGDAPLFPHLPQLLGMRGYRGTLRFGEAPLYGEDRKQLAKRLHREVREIFEPLVDFEPHSPGDPRPKAVVDSEDRATLVSTSHVA